jgi:hypothetical protein
VDWILGLILGLCSIRNDLHLHNEQRGSLDVHHILNSIFPTQVELHVILPTIV